LLFGIRDDRIIGIRERISDELKFSNVFKETRLSAFAPWQTGSDVDRAVLKPVHTGDNLSPFRATYVAVFGDYNFGYNLSPFSATFVASVDRLLEGQRW